MDPIINVRGVEMYVIDYYMLSEAERIKSQRRLDEKYNEVISSDTTPSTLAQNVVIRNGLL